MSFSPRAAVLLASLAVLAGCSSFGSKKPPSSCPAVVLSPDAADITRYRGTGHDVTDLEMDGRIIGVPAQCKRGDDTSVIAEVKVRTVLGRGPAAQSRTPNVAFGVAVMDGDKILDEQDYPITSAFAPNVDRLDVTSEPIVLKLPVSAQKPASAYKIYVYFKLTPQELALNRARGLR